MGCRRDDNFLFATVWYMRYGKWIARNGTVCRWVNKLHEYTVLGIHFTSWKSVDAYWCVLSWNSGTCNVSLRKLGSVQNGNAVLWCEVIYIKTVPVKLGRLYYTVYCNKPFILPENWNNHIHGEVIRKCWICLKFGGTNILATNVGSE